jgi:Flp pilus assembly protein TadG
VSGPRGDSGSSVVEFTLVAVLLVGLFLAVLQLAIVLHTRTVLVSAAQEGARHAANADRTPADGVLRTQQAIGEALGAGARGRMTVTPLPAGTTAGLPVVGMQVSGAVPVLFLPLGPVHLTVSGHALDEG